MPLNANAVTLNQTNQQQSSASVRVPFGRELEQYPRSGQFGHRLGLTRLGSAESESEKALTCSDTSNEAKIVRQGKLRWVCYGRLMNHGRGSYVETSHSHIQMAKHTTRLMCSLQSTTV